MGSRLEAGTTAPAAAREPVRTARGLCSGGAAPSWRSQWQRRWPVAASAFRTPRPPRRHLRLRPSPPPPSHPGMTPRPWPRRTCPSRAGETLAAGVPVQLSDGLREVRGWKPGAQNVAGASRVRQGGRLCGHRQRCGRTSQPSPSPGTTGRPPRRLFQYLDASILPGLPEAGDPALGRRARRARPARRGAGVQGRRTGRRQGHRYLRPAVQQSRAPLCTCPFRAPTPRTLAAARADAEARIAVVPPSA